MTEFEFHISTTAAFTPDSTTLQTTGAVRNRTFSNLDPAKTHYVKVVPIVDGVRGQPSAEVSFVPGRASATQLNPNVQWGNLPLNGSFETQFDTSAPPDFWFSSGGIYGTWGTNMFLLTNASGLSGTNYIKLLGDASVGAELVSAEMMINEKVVVSAFVWRKTKAGTANCSIVFYWYDKDHVFISGTNGATFALNNQVDVWVKEVTSAQTPPANARYCRIQIFCPSAVGNEVHIDACEFDVDPIIRLAGTNNGDVTLAAVGASPNANGATLAAQVLNLQPASATQPGVVIDGPQSFGGPKSFDDDLDVTLAQAGETSATISNSNTGTSARTSLYLLGPGGRYSSLFNFPVGWSTAALADAMLVNTTLPGGLIFFASNAVAASAGFTWMIDSAVSLMQLDYSGRLKRRGTDGSATAGNQTINKTCGKGKIASGATACVISNNLITAASLVQITWESDHGAARDWVTLVAGTSFTVNLNAAAGADTVFSFVVVEIF